MDRILWEYIGDWVEKKYICANCGTDKSVKYRMAGKTYCNRCVIPVSLELEKKMKNKEDEEDE